MIIPHRFFVTFFSRKEEVPFFINAINLDAIFDGNDFRFDVEKIRIDYPNPSANKRFEIGGNGIPKLYKKGEIHLLKNSRDDLVDIQFIDRNGNNVGDAVFYYSDRKELIIRYYDMPKDYN